MTDTREQPGGWFSSVDPGQIGELVERTASDNPEDLADLVDMARLEAVTPEGLARHDALIGAVTQRSSLFSPALLENILGTL